MKNVTVTTKAYLLTTDELLKRIRKRPVLSSTLADLLLPIAGEIHDP